MKAEETDLNGIVFLPLKNESGEEYANRIERWEAGEKVEGQSRTYAGNENNYMVIQFIKCAYDKAVDLYAAYDNVSVLPCELVIRPDKGQ